MQKHWPLDLLATKAQSLNSLQCATAVLPCRVQVRLSQLRFGITCYHNLFHFTVQTKAFHTNCLVQWIIYYLDMQQKCSRQRSEVLHSGYCKCCLRHDSVPKTDLECVPLKPNSSNNSIEQLLETLKLYRLSCVSRDSKFNTSGTRPTFFTSSIITFSGHQLEWEKKKKEKKKKEKKSHALKPAARVTWEPNNLITFASSLFT